MAGQSHFNTGESAAHGSSHLRVLKCDESVLKYEYLRYFNSFVAQDKRTFISAPFFRALSNRTCILFVVFKKKKEIYS